VKSDPRDIRDPKFALYRHLNTTPEEKGRFKLLYVGRRDKLVSEIRSTLRFFSFIGNQIDVIQTTTLEEAKNLGSTLKGLVFILVDVDVDLNGSFDAFSMSFQNKHRPSPVYITTTEKLLRALPADEQNNEENELKSDQSEASERLKDIVRMILLTNEIDLKLNLSAGLGIPSEIPDDKPACKGKSINITRDKLYTILAHELKEPVGNIKVMLDFLTREKELLDKNTYNDLLHNVRQSVDSINEMLDDFLFWTRMNKHHIQYNPRKVSVEQIIRENATLLKSTAANKNITIETQLSGKLSVYADEYMITTVVRNLIYNAIKFTEKSGKIRISAEEKSGYVKVTVSDNGIGISDKDLKKLFKTDIHYKTRGTAMESGTGVGLVLCKDFVEKNGGTISVKSKPKKGTTFQFTLPVWENVSAN